MKYIGVQNVEFSQAITIFNICSAINGIVRRLPKLYELSKCRHVIHFSKHNIGLTVFINANIFWKWFNNQVVFFGNLLQNVLLMFRLSNCDDQTLFKRHVIQSQQITANDVDSIISVLAFSYGFYLTRRQR